MTMFDLPLAELQVYLPVRDEPLDFDAFWQMTLSETRAFPLNAIFEPANPGFKLVEVYDVTFNGYGGQPIKGWFVLPKGHSGALPCVVEFIGYGGGRGKAHDWLLWANMGYANFIMDTRGQGSAHSPGDTSDVEPAGSNPQHPGFMTRGVLSNQTYYYRRVYTDAVRAIEAARSHPAVNPERVAVTGGSQGGGISLAAAGLDTSVAAALPDVPFLCHMRVATEITDKDPYNEFVRYCKVHRDHIETVFRTVSYFDGVNFAARATSPTLFSVALMDEICPPRTVYAAYNHYQGAKDIRIYPYNYHEGGGTFQTLEKMRFLANLWDS
jgi:cephalosporin-C deacetylase